MNKPQTNPLEMSDEDFLNMNGPPASPEGEEVETSPADEEEDEEEEDDSNDSAADEDNSEDDDDSSDEGSEGNSEDDPDDSDDDGDEDSSSDEDADGEGEGEAGNVDPAKETDETSDKDTDAESDGTEESDAGDKADKAKSKKNDKKAAEAEESSKSVDYEAFYKQVMAPFKANGKTITLRDPNEVIQLMQMGANYTKKLQDIQPHRKMLLMLKNNELLDEGKLSYLIDLSKKEPEAIKKLIKDSGIDPLDIDTESEPNYRAGNHKVSDEQAMFVEAIEDLSSSDEGKETLQTIDRTWDDASKEALWKSPNIMAVIHQQRNAGVYDQIVEEMDRQITLGQLQSSTPFLERYQTVGKALEQAGAFGRPSNDSDETPAPKPERQKVGERAAKPKSKVKSGDKASAASTARNTPRKTEKLVNPLAMSDEEFLKNFENRL